MKVESNDFNFEKKTSFIFIKIESFEFVLFSYFPN